MEESGSSNNVFSRQIMSSTKLLEVIYELYRRDYIERIEEMRNPNIVYVTDLVGCSHKYWFRTKFPELAFYFEPALVLGELVHKGLEAILASQGYSIEYPVEHHVFIDDREYVVKGRVDAWNPVSREVVEIKTARSSHGVPHEHHILQLQIYMEILGVDKGLLVYITPDRLLEYTVLKASVDIEGFVRELVGDSVHPRWDWECRYCVYSKLCPYRRV